MPDSTDGLTFSIAGSRIDTKIKEFTGYNNAGIIQDFTGSQFPYSPKWTVIGDAQYDFPISSTIDGFVGGGLTYNSSAMGSIGNVEILKIRAYTLVDLRAGVKSSDEKWIFHLWGRNITNEYYWTNALQTQDGYVRYAGKPVTYGGSVSFRF
ncbi:MAG: TonB-dependent receptor [Novosphingobium sp.]